MDKLKLYLESKEIKPSEFAKMIGKSRQYVNNVLNGNQNFGMDFINDVIGAFNDIDLNWLLKNDHNGGNYSVNNDTTIVNEKKYTYTKKNTVSDADNYKFIIDKYQDLCNSQQLTIDSLKSIIETISNKQQP